MITALFNLIQSQLATRLIAIKNLWINSLIIMFLTMWCSTLHNTYTSIIETQSLPAPLLDARLDQLLTALNLRMSMMSLILELITILWHQPRTWMMPRQNLDHGTQSSKKKMKLFFKEDQLLHAHLWNATMSLSLRKMTILSHTKSLHIHLQNTCQENPSGEPTIKSQNYLRKYMN